MEDVEFIFGEYGGRVRKLYRSDCEFCNAEYYRPRHIIGRFCSPLCYRTALQKRVAVTCAFCGEGFTKTPSKMRTKSGLHFCSRECKDSGQRIESGILSIAHYGDGRHYYREKAMSSYDAKCIKCGYDDDIAAIVVHHKDRDRSNNNLANLEVLCRNCHAIEHLG